MKVGRTSIPREEDLPHEMIGTAECTMIAHAHAHARLAVHAPPYMAMVLEFLLVAPNSNQAYPPETTLAHLRNGQQAAGANTAETEIPERIMRVETGRDIAIDHRRVEEDRATETGTERDTGRQITAMAEATAAAGALVEGTLIGAELHNAYQISGLEEIRVIRDRQTRLSRQLGFLRFASIDDSRAFLEQNHPFIYLYGPSAGENDRSTKVRIAYSREREDRNRVKTEADWTCRMCAVVNFATRPKCFRCNAPRPGPEIIPVGPPGVPPPKIANNGDNDAAPDSQPSQFILLRGLESSVTEELLAKGVAKLYRPTAGNNDAPTSASQKKGAKVASTTGDSNLGAREGSIRRVLLVRDRKTNESWRFGFAEFANVLDAQAAIARLNSFEKFTISSKPVLVSYIHAGVFVPVMDPNPSAAQFTFSPLANPSAKLMYWDDEGYASELMLASGEENVEQDRPTSAKGPGSREQSDAKGARDSEKAKKRKAEAAAGATAKKLAMPSQLQFWSNRHAELHGISKEGTETAVEGELEKANSLVDANAPPAQSFADLTRNCCYLCMRQFKSSANVNRHERLSQLHRENLQNEEAKARGMSKLIKHGIIPQPAEYRDRARERRQAFGRGKKSGARNKAAAPKDEEPAQTTSKGASLLSKMGWSAGSGLGATGTGVTAPIATEIYAQGVGLGAQGGKLGDAVEEAGRNTRGRYDEFLEKTRETARQRYDQMNQGS
ncbi:hypothetical protein POX_g08884 [Penicillium oxalicum]|uniref:hypothetical protein n=1 Tax=Penicillium oxalicum TaxID=69781 RepID=UPI0020B729E1|nr:hypothetical protein POX_g08884 [Penicillium oxalicum]KAI2786498.1 hypothetical protein POX_g08884 [Penicillium oxalicum]